MMMMRRGALVAVVVGLVMAVFATPVGASVFVDFVEFDGPGLGPGNTGSLGVFDDEPPPWLHDVTDTVGGTTVDILLATLSVSYRGTGGNELWTLLGDGVGLGTLPPTEAILTTAFALSPEAIAALEADGRLAVVPAESTPFRDGFRLYEATLRGEYHTLPEPPALMVWWLVLLHRVGRRRRLRRLQRARPSFLGGAQRVSTVLTH